MSDSVMVHLRIMPQNLFAVFTEKYVPIYIMYWYCHFQMRLKQGAKLEIFRGGRHRFWLKILS